MPHNLVNIDDVLATEDSASPIAVSIAGASGVKVMKLNGEYDFHSHAVDEVFVILEGDLEMDYEAGETLPLKTGDVLKVDAGRRHRTRTKRPSKVLLVGPQ